MGLDAVELVMAVEEKFGISITDEEATKAVTVGDLKHLVRTKLDVADADGCPLVRLPRWKRNGGEVSKP